MIHSCLVFILCLYHFTNGQESSAIAIITPVGSSTISGTISFISTSPTATSVTVKLTGLSNPDALHGIHVHVYGDLRGFITNMGTIPANVSGAASVGSHFDPYLTLAHHCPDANGVNNGSHAGDLGNWQATGGSIDLTKTFSNFTLNGVSNSIIGRAIVVHDLTDDCNDINSSGGRIGVGVIGIKSANTNGAKAVTGRTTAVCVLQGTDACTDTYCKITNSGFVWFNQTSANSIKIVARVFGINDERGFHIHTFGDLSSADGSSLGGHWNPENKKHGLPGDAELHLGDLGSIYAFAVADPHFGIYEYEITSSSVYWSLDNIIGRGIIVHTDLDHGNTPTCPGSDLNGAAGKRLFQCVVGIQNPNSLLPVIDNTGYLPLENKWKVNPCPYSSALPTASYISSFILLVFLVIINFLF